MEEGKVGAIRNPDGIWINSSVFKEEGTFFDKNGYYCIDRPGTRGYKEYWDEQLKRCIEGYSVGGAKITGHHYHYLNFLQINLTEQLGGKVGKKVVKTPDFWDGDYNFYWSLEIARNGVLTNDALILPSTKKELILQLDKEKQDIAIQKAINDLKLHVTIDPEYLTGGYGLIVGKARRKGYSFKNAGICVNIYNTIRNSLCIIGASDKKYLYPKGTMGMASNYLDFLNKNTAWRKGREYVNIREHKKASFKEIKDGVEIESGYKSEIMAITFGDNSDAARGKDPYLMLYEEAGAFPNLKSSYLATKEGSTDGMFTTGQSVIFGTGGDMESGTTDFAEMFYNPKQYDLLPFINIWDKNSEGTFCGFFHPTTWNMTGAYDLQGNSNILFATQTETARREKIIKDSTNSGVIQQRMQEHPFSPDEAFLTVSSNDFPIQELRGQYNKVVREKLHLKYGHTVTLFRDSENKVKSKLDLERKLEPLYDYEPKTKNINGAVIIYEYPIENAPKGLYKIGFDPYRQANSNAKLPSLGAIYVYKSNDMFSYTHDTIVAEYVGRPYDPDDVNRQFEMLIEMYNTQGMYENEVTHVKSYFTNRRKLHLLAAQPDNVIKTATKGKSKVSRTYGVHMNEQIKDAGEKYIKKWLLTERNFNEDGEKILNLHTIYSPALLEELMLYNRKGNFDRVMGFMMVMIQLNEDLEGKIYKPQYTNPKVDQILNLNLFAKN
jgi:hypothetical protein